MNERARQKEATRSAILQAALDEFSEKGFEGASTRAIAGRAGAHHALIKYHFQSKDALWREAVTFLFERQARELSATAPNRQAFATSRDYAREVIRQRVLYWARRPEHARLMMQESCRDSERFRWMVDTFVVKTSQVAEEFVRYLQKEGLVPDLAIPSLVYIFVGGAQLIYILAPEAHRVWGVDPFAPAAVEAHADALADLLLR